MIQSGLVGNQNTLPTLHILIMKVKEVITLLKEEGWQLVRTQGSHRQFKHSLKSGCVTVSGKPSVEVPPGTLNSILKQAGLK